MLPLQRLLMNRLNDIQLNNGDKSKNSSTKLFHNKGEFNINC